MASKTRYESSSYDFSKVLQSDFPLNYGDNQFCINSYRIKSPFPNPRGFSHPMASDIYINMKSVRLPGTFSRVALQYNCTSYETGKSFRQTRLG
jgi:hypothetical protein